MDAPQVIVETHLAGGLPGFTLVGLPETAVREARDRVRSALANCGFEFPDGRLVVNLAPADLLKEGGRFDLAIAISILRATGQLRAEPPGCAQYEFLGELSLSGELRAIRGSLCAAIRLEPGQQLIVPFANAGEALLAEQWLVPMGHLKDVVNWLTQGSKGARTHCLSAPGASRSAATAGRAPQQPIIGQQMAKRALALAASGGHHLLMIGPPGTGKSLLARHLPELLPPLDERAAMEVAAVYSAAGIEHPDVLTPPLRDPHHSISAAAMVGGGRQVRPGEISLAHHGVLFLDELPHFKPGVLDSLREPLETRRINIVRSNWRATFPASFQLIAAMNPCPAGLICSPETCRCRPDQVLRYQGRISGPLLDRIDLHVPVPEVPRQLLLEPARDAQVWRVEDIRQARQRQLQRQGLLNSTLAGPGLDQAAALDAAGRKLLSRASARYRLSARGFHRVLRVARTVADLEAEQKVAASHVAEALSYRSLRWGSEMTGAP